MRAWLVIGCVAIVADTVAFLRVGAAGEPGQAASGPADHRAAVAQHFEKSGIAVDFSLTPVDREPSGKNPGLVAGSDALAQIRVRDARTGQPLTGVRPRAWMTRRRSEFVADETECADKVKSFAGGFLSVRGYRPQQLSRADAQPR